MKLFNIFNFKKAPKETELKTISNNSYNAISNELAKLAKSTGKVCPAYQERFVSEKNKYKRKSLPLFSEDVKRRLAELLSGHSHNDNMQFFCPNAPKINEEEKILKLKFDPLDPLLLEHLFSLHLYPTSDVAQLLRRLIYKIISKGLFGELAELYYTEAQNPDPKRYQILNHLMHSNALAHVWTQVLEHEYPIEPFRSSDSPLFKILLRNELVPIMEQLLPPLLENFEIILGKYFFEKAARPSSLACSLHHLLLAIINKEPQTAISFIKKIKSDLATIEDLELTRKIDGKILDELNNEIKTCHDVGNETEIFNRYMPIIYPLASEISKIATDILKKGAFFGDYRCIEKKFFDHDYLEIQFSFLQKKDLSLEWTNGLIEQGKKAVEKHAAIGYMLLAVIYQILGKYSHFIWLTKYQNCSQPTSSSIWGQQSLLEKRNEYFKLALEAVEISVVIEPFCFNNTFLAFHGSCPANSEKKPFIFNKLESYFDAMEFYCGFLVDYCELSNDEVIGLSMKTYEKLNNIYQWQLFTKNPVVHKKTCSSNARSFLS